MKTKLLILLFTTSLITTACQKVLFSPIGTPVGAQMDPVSAVSPADPALFKAGVCVDQQNIASCLKCDNPAPVPPPPPVATKAQKLAQIMKMSCQIYNRSYPGNYQPPANREIDARVLACTDALYPETSLSAFPKSTIDQLLDAGNDFMRRKFFAGLWYQPPYTDHFEAYFGLEGKEAAAVFCLGQQISGPLLTSEYAQAISNGRLTDWQNDPAAQARWNAAQLVRSQLLSCLNKPGSPPAPVPPPGSAKICDYKSFEGRLEQGGRDHAFRLLTDGYKLAVETSNSCEVWDQVPAAGSFEGRLKIIGYRCR